MAWSPQGLVIPLGRNSLKWDSDITGEHPKVTRFYFSGAKLPTAKEVPAVAKKREPKCDGYLELSWHENCVLKSMLQANIWIHMIA